jgi:hypothetical protein
MTQATRVHSTPPTSTSANNPPEPVDQARRRFLTVAAGGAVAAMAMAIATTARAAGEGINLSAPSLGIEADPAFALIAAHRAAEVAYGEVIAAQDDAEAKYGIRSDEAWEAADRCGAMCEEVNAIAWKLASSPPTTLAGVAAVLRFANEVEDVGGEWPDTDTIGPDG